MGIRQAFPGVREAVTVVCDAGPPLHLHWVGAAHWALPSNECLLPAAVWDEVARLDARALGYPQLTRVPDPPPRPELASWRLDVGETAALSIALSMRDAVLVLCDEAEARRACDSLGLQRIGSVGLIVEAALANRATPATAEGALRTLPTIGRCWVSDEVVEAAIARIRFERQSGA
jgi:predicted nucleic acid-binding protein